MPLSKTVSKKDLAPALSRYASLKKKKEAKNIDGAKILELGLLLDCAGSMESWIIRAKENLNEIIKNVV